MKLANRVTYKLFLPVTLLFSAIGAGVYVLLQPVVTGATSVLLQGVMAGVFATTVVCLWVLNRLFHRMVVLPLKQLERQIRSARSESILPSLPVQGDDELAILNRSYLTLLRDTQSMASSDVLTGLANRHSFSRWMERSLPRTLQSNQTAALLYIDLDNFKRVNDHYGHEMGDRLLIDFSRRLMDSIRGADMVMRLGQSDNLARLGGDEFALLLTDLNGPHEAELVAKRLLKTFQGGYVLDGLTFQIQASIGIALLPDDGDQPQQLLKHADAAMYQAKRSGKNCYRFYTKSIAEAMAYRQTLEDDVRRAVADACFELEFLPIYDCRELNILAVEVLLRSPLPSLAEAGPEKFIPIAESTGLIRNIDYWVLDQMLQLQAKLETDEMVLPVDFCINLSVVELGHSEFAADLAQMLNRYGVSPKRLVLEFSEKQLKAQDQACLRELSALGVQLSLDDFGTGQIAVNHMADYAFSSLKVDRSLLQGDQEENSGVISVSARRALQVGKLYDLQVIAEGVENAEQLVHLRQLGCNAVQGYYLSQPLSQKRLEQLLAEMPLVAKSQPAAVVNLPS